MKASYYEGNRTFGVREGAIQKPGRGEVRLKISYCGVCGTDVHIFQGHMDSRVKIPQVIGHEMSGEIVELGEGVERFSIGNRVVVRPLSPCSRCPACKAGYSHICYNLKFLGIDTPGAFQEFWTVPAYTLHRLPESVSMKHAALIEPLSVACHDVRMGEVKKNAYVVVIGGGPIGMLVALVSKNKGAQVFLSEINPFRLNLGRELGLEVINPKKEDIVPYIENKTGKAGADVAFEVSASDSGVETVTKLVKARGRIVIVGIFSNPAKVDLFRFFWRELQLFGARVYEPQDFEEAISLVASKSLPLDILISEVRPLEELHDTLRKIESGAEGMKTLIDISM